MAAKWMVAAKKADFEKIAKECGISPILARLIRNREVVGSLATTRYLTATTDNLYSPQLLPDAERAVALLREKIAQGRRIRIIGDYDVDGVCSSYILYAALRRLGAAVDVVLPERLTDGYGMNERMIEAAAADGVDTIVTCDNGIAAAQPVALAKEKGMTVIVTDHHEVPFTEAADGTKTYRLPPADAVVDPKRIDAETGRTYYPFPEICGAVVAYKLMQALLEAQGDERAASARRWLEENLLPFCALATVCDVMPLQNENRIIVRYGLQGMTAVPNPGLRALLAVNDLADGPVTCYHAGFILGPCLNASGRLETAKKALALFTGEALPEEEEAACGKTAAAHTAASGAQLVGTSQPETAAEPSGGGQGDNAAQPSGGETEDAAESPAPARKKRRGRRSNAEIELEKLTAQWTASEEAARCSEAYREAYLTALRRAEELKALNHSRKTMTAKGVEEAVAAVETGGLLRNAVLVVYLPDCHESLAGIIAGKVRERYSRPAFVLTPAEDGTVKGSGRSTEKYDMYAGLTACKDLFLKFGGHKMAGGLTLPADKIEAFSERINAHCTLTEADFCEVLHLDMELPTSHVTTALTQELEKLEPCGNGNRKPLFACRSLIVYNMRIMGQTGNALKLTLRDREGHYVDALHFGDASAALKEIEAKRRGARAAVMDVVYYPQLHTWRGQTSLQFVVRDYRLH